jgi:hypothetical protein
MAMAEAKEPAFVERLELVNPNRIANYWQQDKRPLYFNKRWRFLRLDLTEYEFVHSYHVHEIGVETEMSEVLQISDTKPANENFDGLSEEEKKEFRRAHVKNIKAADPARSLALRVRPETLSGVA